MINWLQTPKCYYFHFLYRFLDPKIRKDTKNPYEWEHYRKVMSMRILKTRVSWGSILRYKTLNQEIWVFTNQSKASILLFCLLLTYSVLDNHFSHGFQDSSHNRIQNINEIAANRNTVHRHVTLSIVVSISFHLNTTVNKKIHLRPWTKRGQIPPQ